METISLILLVFVLGLRHGLDADHLACIDGLTRYNWRLNRPIARWVGTLFSFGHGLTVTCIATILSLFMKHFYIPGFIDTLVTWISVVSLFGIGTLNAYNLLHIKSASIESYQITGIKGKLLPRFAQETTNPFLVILIGGLFAIAADTVSQTSMWAIAAGNSGNYMPFIMGIIFMLGMMLTDTIDSMLTFRIINQSNRLGQSASIFMGWVIVFLAYGVSFYEVFTLFFPQIELNFEMAGIIIFMLLVLYFIFLSFRLKNRSTATLKNR